MFWELLYWKISFQLPKVTSSELISQQFLAGDSLDQKAADVWKKDVWNFQAFSQTLLELQFSLGNEGKDGKNLNSQTWPGTPRHPRPPDWSVDDENGFFVEVALERSPLCGAYGSSLS